MLFLKPFKIQSNGTLRETKRRKLIQKVTEDLHLSTEDANAIFKNKAASEIKIHTSTRHDIVSYLFDGVPLFFLYEDRIFPTVFILSLLSSSNVPLLYTYGDAMDRICGGSDLMVSDVIKTEPFGCHINALKKSSMCSVAAVVENTANRQCSKPLAVGIYILSAAEFKAAGDEDRAVQILHTFHDKLTDLCPSHLLNSYKLTDKVEIDYGIERAIPSEVPIDEASSGDCSPELDGDYLLMFCFLRALRDLKPTDLPLPVNVFYAKHMKSNCPNGNKMDIRRTSYKKVSVFLERMATEGILTLETVDVGITRLTAFQKNHPKLQELEEALPESVKSSSIAGGESFAVDSTYPKFVVGDFYFGPPVLQEVRLVTSQIVPLLASSGYKTGDGIEQANICRIVGAYVDSKNLRSVANRDLINVDGLLVRICEPNLLRESPGSTLAEPLFQITFQDLITSVTKGLKVAWRMTYPPESGLMPVITTDKSPKLNLYEVRRNGKDATRIAGLSNFGIDPKPFSRYIQTKLACSAILTEDPRFGNSTVVQAQGRHTTALSKMLTEAFGLPKKWIVGFQESAKKKSGRK